MQAIKSSVDESTWNILSNALSMVGTIGITSGLGFIYWVLAAKLFPQEVVGFASSAVSAMILLGIFGMMGMGTLIISDLPRRPEHSGSLIVTAISVTGVITLVVGIGFALLSPYLSPDLAPLAENPMRVLLFASGVSMSGMSIALDQALVGLLHGHLQFIRNLTLGLLKLIILWGFGLVSYYMLGIPIFMSWWLGTIFALLVTIFLFARKQLVKPPFRFNLSLLKGMGRYALLHHTVNLMLEMPKFVFPVLVTIILGARLSAVFFMAWMMAALIFAGADALTFVLYAVGSKDKSIFAQKMRLTLSLSSLAGLGGIGVVMLFGPNLLGIFGEQYVAATWCLRIMAIGVFPLIIKVHYAAIKRTNDEISEAAMLLTTGTLFEILGASIGMYYGNLTGLAIGWFIGISLEAALMLPTVWRAYTIKASVEDKNVSGIEISVTTS